MTRRRFPWGVDDDGHFRVDRIVQAAASPVYGLAGHPFGLSFQGMGYSGVGPRTPPSVIAVSCIFVSPPTEPVPYSITIESRGPDVPPPVAASWVDAPPGTPFSDEDGKPFARYPTLAAARSAGAITTQLLIDTLVVAGDPFVTKIQQWSRPEQEHHAVLQGPRALVTVSALELSGTRLLDLLEQLIIINARPDLLAQYQNEHDTWRRSL